jgi:glucokinase
MTPVYLGVDLGGTHLRVGLRAAGSPDLLDVEWTAASGEWDAPALIATIGGLLDRLSPRHPGERWQILGAGAALTGDIHLAAGTCHSMKRFPRLEGVHLVRHLEEAFGAPAAILNDGLAAALAELRLGAGRGAPSFVMITLGTGIGGGIVLDGNLLTGPSGRVGKVGHQIIDQDGPVHCHCGLPGCWQSFAGKEGIAARAREAAGTTPESRLAQLIARAGEVDLKRVSELAAAGDAAARAVVEETGRYVGIGLSNLVKLFAPDLLLIGGGIAEGNALLLASAQETLDRYAIKPYQRVPIQAAQLGSRAGVVGASLWAEDVPSHC